MNINVELEHFNETENLKINLDEIKFVDILDINGELKEQKVYDLVLKNTPNYILSKGGIVHNGGGKRKGAFAIYLEPWHADVNDFLELKKNHGKEEVRARDLFYALWVPDLFMKRVKEQGQWTLMCPHECPGLADVWGDEFETLYTKYESEGRGRQTIQAVDLWYKIIESQFETGMPYILYKDAANRKSNQQNLGTIKSSNLCAEILEYTEGGDNGQVAVCNLASLSLSSFVYKSKFDYKNLEEVAYQTVLNLNKVIDRNYYPTQETYRSNMKHRPVGLGVQGLANVFAEMKIAFDSNKAKEVNKLIFETIYWGALNASCDLAEKTGAYESFDGSPASKGILQFDMWNLSPDSTRYDWEGLKQRIIKYGLKNSLLLALMPTASCLTSDTVIKTLDGDKSYKTILSENNIDFKTIEKTSEQKWIFFDKPFNIPTRFGEKQIDKIFYNGIVPTLNIEMEDGTIVNCSYNHKFLCLRNNEEIWVRADELNENDDLVSFK